MALFTATLIPVQPEASKILIIKFDISGVGVGAELS